MKAIFEIIQNTFSKSFELILNNKYLKAALITSAFIIFVGLIVIIVTLAFRVPTIGGILIFIIIYLMVLSDL